MDDILGIAASGVSGGALGVVGNFLNRVFGVWEAKVRFEQQIQLERLKAETDARKESHEIQLIGLEMQQAAAETEHAIELTDVSGGWDAFNSSVASEISMQSDSGVAAFIRTTMRPFITYGLWIVTAGFVVSGYGGDELAMQLGNSSIFAASTCTLWWFGERNGVRTQNN